MKRIRIGNDINISLRVLTEGEARPLEGRNLRLMLRDPKGGESEVDFSAVGNTLGFVFPGRDQKYIGRYGVELWENEGKALQAVTDVIEAFVLVQKSDEQGGNDTADLRTESIELSLELDDAQACLAALFASGKVGDSLDDDKLVLQRGNTVYTITVAALQGMLKERINKVEQCLTNTQGTIDSAIKSSKSYTDVKVSQAVGDAKGYTEEKVSAVANEQLKLSVKDNGDIVLSNAKGESKEFMPATPSGDPNHEVYLKFGNVKFNEGDDVIEPTPWATLVDDADYNARWNLNVIPSSAKFVKTLNYNGVARDVYEVNHYNYDKIKIKVWVVADRASDGTLIKDDSVYIRRSKMWAMNGLGDLSNSDMAQILVDGHPTLVTGSGAALFSRTSLTVNGATNFDIPTDFFFYNTYAETIRLSTTSNLVSNFAFRQSRVRCLVGGNNGSGPANILVKKDINIMYLQYTGIEARTNIVINVSKISAKSIIDMLNKTTATVTITFPSSLYNRLMDTSTALGAELVALLNSKSNITFASQ